MQYEKLNVLIKCDKSVVLRRVAPRQCMSKDIILCTGILF